MNWIENTSLMVKDLLKTSYILILGYTMYFINKIQDKRTKEYKLLKIIIKKVEKIMENSYAYAKSLILLAEHAAMVVAGAVAGWIIANKHKKKKDIIKSKEIKEELKQALIEERKQIKKVKIVKQQEMPRGGKELIKAIGDVWLYKNFFGRTLNQ
jgi:hypothetical protein